MEGAKNDFGCPPDNRINQMNAPLVQQIPFQLRAADLATDWCLVQMR